MFIATVSGLKEFVTNTGLIKSESMMENNKTKASEIIDALGGTNRVARLFFVAPPCVTAWRTRGIPEYFDLWLRTTHPDLYRDGKS